MKKIYNSTYISNQILNKTKLLFALFALFLTGYSYGQSYTCDDLAGSEVTVGQCVNMDTNTNNDYWNGAAGCNSADLDDGWAWFTATTNSTTITYTPTGTQDPILHLFTGTCSTTMAALTCADGGGYGVAETITYATTPGTKYRVRIQRWNSNWPMYGTLCITCNNSYCGITYGTAVEAITNVTFAGINNTTGAGTTGGSHEYICTPTGTVNAGSSYAISLNGDTGGAYQNSFTAFFDWNQDGTFNNTTERYNIGTINNNPGNGTPATNTIAVPAGATPGTTSMRIIKRYDTGPLYATDACTPGSGYGQTEDYYIDVLASTPCSQPTAQATGLTFGAATLTSITGNFTAASPAPDNYLVLMNTSGVAPAPAPIDTNSYTIGSTVGGATVVDNDSDTTFTATGLSNSTTYYFFIYSFNDACSGGPDYLSTTPHTGNQTTLTPENMVPASGNNSYTLCSGNLYDSGGSTGNYANSSNGYTVLNPTTGGSLVQVSGTIITEGGWDYLTIYDGVGTGGTVLWGGAPHGSGTACNSFAVPLTTSTLGSLTVQFYADGSNNCSGFDLSISCFTPAACTQPTAQATGLTFGAITGTTIAGSFTAAVPAPDNYLILMNTSGVTPAPAPVDTNSYTIGSTVGGATVIDNDTDTAFTATGLTPNTTYYFFIYSFNDACTGGPDYFTTSPLTGNDTTPLSYCTPVSSYTSDYIDDFSTTGGLTNITNNNTGAGTTSAGYSDFTAQSASQIQGGILNFTAAFYDSPSYSYGFNLWVDWNDDGDFTDAGEQFPQGTSTGLTSSFTIPLTASVGAHRMRIRSEWLNSSPDSCNTIDWGEAEDYTLNVIGLTPCTQPTSQPSALTFSGVTNSSITGNFTAASPTPDNYLVLMNTSGVAPAPAPADTNTYTIGSTVSGATVIDTDTNTTFTANGLSANTTYYFYVYSFNSACSGGPDYLSTSPLLGNDTTLMVTYCEPTHPGQVNRYIDDFITTGNITDISNLNTGFNGSGYNDYTSQVVTQTQGGSVAFSSQFGNGNQNFGASLWVDYNNDAIFSPAEEVYTSGGFVNSISGTFIIPLATPAGSYRMRILIDWNITSPDPCSYDNGRGEAEDYTLTVVTPTPCSTPTGQPSGLTFTSVTSNNISASFTDAVPVPDNYLVVMNTSGTPPTITNGTTYNIGDTLGAGNTVIDIDNNTIFTATSLSPTQTYYFFVYSYNNVACSGGPLYNMTSPLTGNATTPVASNYCEGASTIDESDHYIDDVEFIGTLNDVQNFNNGYSSTPTIGYDDFTGLPNAVQAQGEGVNVFVEANFNGHYKAWVDWDRNGAFSNAEEVYDTGGVATTSATFGFVIPSNQAIGVYRLRIRFYNTSGIIPDYSYDFDACEDFDTRGSYNEYGETEDYNFTVVPSCDAKITSITEPTICGEGTANLVVTGSASTVEYKWYANENDTTPFATTTSGTWTTPVINSSTIYYVTADNGTCESTVKTKIKVTVNQVTTLSFTPTTPIVCGEDNIIEITATATDEVAYLIDEDFEGGGLGVFSVNNIQNNQNGDTEWQNRTSTFVPSTDPAYQVWFPAISSGFGSNNFVMATSDVPNIAITETALESASVDASLFTDLTLSFDIYFSRYLFNVGIPEDVTVEVSANGGAWTTVKTYNDDVGYGTAFTSLEDLTNAENPIDLSAYIGVADLKVRIKYYANYWCDGVAIDNVQLYGTTPLTSSFAWTSATTIDAFTDAAATIPYVTGTTVSAVYVKPTPTQLQLPSFSFVATATMTNGCDVSSNISITNNTKYFVEDNGSTDWNDPNNWKPAGVPTLDNCVIIPDTFSGIIDGSTHGEALNVSVRDGGGLTVEPNGNLTIVDFLEIEPTGDFVVEDNGSLIQINDIANTGNGTIDRESAPVISSDYVYWSSPVTGYNITGVPGNARYRWVPTIPGNGIGAHGNWAGASGNMVVGKGYIKRTGINGNAAASFIGQVNNGTLTTPIQSGDYDLAATYTGLNPSKPSTRDDDNWNLIGNPYPSSLNADKFLAANTNITGSVRVWTHGTPISPSGTPQFYQDYSNNYSVSDYIVYNASGGTVLGFEGNIASGQGFMVLAEHVSGGTAPNNDVLTFTNDMRYTATGPNTYNHYGNSQFYRTTGNNFNPDDTAEKHRLWFTLVSPSEEVYNTMIGYIGGATNQEDRLYDAKSTDLNSMNIFSILDNERMVIQGRGLPFNEEDMVPMGVITTEAGMHTIGINNADGLFTNDSQDIFLEDLELGVVHDLRANPYTFTAGIGRHDRFILRYMNNTLGVDTVDAVNNLEIIATNNYIKVTSGKSPIKSVIVYDILGRVLANHTNINALEFKLESLKPTNGTLIVKAITTNGAEKAKKVVY
ncbi:MAG: GEVED domain-containing protein [Oceanihabitans sp.]